MGNLLGLKSVVFSDHIWAQQPNKDLFAFSGVDGKFSMVSLPYSQCQFATISVCSEAVWGLTAADGKIFVRAGMTSHCPLGVNWIPLDFSQLGEKIALSSLGVQGQWETV
jgi:hypothetical protein